MTSTDSFLHHTLRPKQDQVPVVPSGVYGAVAGVVNGPLSDADNNHVFIPLFVASGTGKGVWKIAFNVESKLPPNAAQYHLVDEAITDADFPKPGFTTNERLSYAELGLKNAQFTIVSNGKLRTLVHSSVSQAQLVVAYGFTFPGGGLHDVHYNNGEPPGSGHPAHPGKDGALCLYYHEATGQAVRRWIFIKFQTQSL